jgi:hypothetical protein
MECNDVEPGMRVRIGDLGSTLGMLIADKHLNVRKSGTTGVITRYVPGHGGDVWFVKHDDSDEIGAYCFTEMESVTDSKWQTFIKNLGASARRLLSLISSSVRG